MQLKVTAGLSIGNFACSEEHTDQLIAGPNPTSQVLIDLLNKHQVGH